MIYNNVTNFLETCLQYDQVPSYFDTQFKGQYFFNINKIHQVTIYDYQYDCLIRNAVIYTKNIGLFLLHHDPAKKTLNIQSKIEIPNQGTVHINNNTFAIGNDLLRKFLIEYLIEKTVFLGYMTQENHLRYYFFIQHKQQNAILVVANENCKIVYCNRDLVEKLRTGYAINFHSLLEYSVFVRNMDNKDDIYDILVMNFIGHEPKNHTDDHKFVLVRYSKKQGHILFTQKIYHQCSDRNKNKAENVYIDQ